MRLRGNGKRHLQMLGTQSSAACSTGNSLCDDECPAACTALRPPVSNQLASVVGLTATASDAFRPPELGQWLVANQRGSIVRCSTRPTSRVTPPPQYQDMRNQVDNLSTGVRPEIKADSPHLASRLGRRPKLRLPNDGYPGIWIQGRATALPADLRQEELYFEGDVILELLSTDRGPATVQLLGELRLAVSNTSHDSRRSFRIAKKSALGAICIQ
jgi:hypothetical protein